MVPDITVGFWNLLVMGLFYMKKNFRLEVEKLASESIVTKGRRSAPNRLSFLIFVKTAVLAGIWYMVTICVELITEGRDPSYEYHLLFPKMKVWYFLVEFGLFCVLPFLISQQIYLFAILT